MSYLVDTHVLIWYVDGNKNLSKKIISILESQQSEVFVSNASLWEIAIKISIGKLSLSVPLTGIKRFLSENSFELLEYDYSDLEKLTRLPFHHNDPFDRMIISQAIAKHFTVISDDEKFKKYPIKLVL